jgi:uncharacterized membrane protein
MNDRVNDQTGGPLKPVPVPSTSPSLQSGEPQRAGTSQVLIHKQTVVTSSGPLPQAAELAAYNQAVPDGAQRIVAMAEKQAGHRMSIEAQVIKAQIRQGYLGQVFALAIAMAALSTATYIAVSGKDSITASVIGGTTILGLVTAFLHKQSTQARELEAKRPPVGEPSRSPEPSQSKAGASPTRNSRRQRR